MAQAPFDTASVLDVAGDADLLASALDEIGIEAQELARTVASGFHGRRRPGMGDSFWEYRHFSDGDHAYQIDWRRSGRSEEGHYFVRETEFETSQTIWVWTDFSASMGFRSELAPSAKADRAILLMLALTQLLVGGGERVALPGQMTPTAHRRAPRLIAEHLSVALDDLMTRLPPSDALTVGSSCVIFSDFLDPIDELSATLTELAETDISLHLVEIRDPAEALLPYSGRVEFRSPEGGKPYLAGKTEILRDDYAAALADHHQALLDLAGHLGASLLSHRTDHAPESALLALAARISEADAFEDFEPSAEQASAAEPAVSP